jgi:hypothetical protein
MQPSSNDQSFGTDGAKMESLDMVYMSTANYVKGKAADCEPPGMPRLILQLADTGLETSQIM